MIELFLIAKRSNLPHDVGKGDRMWTELNKSR